VTDAVESDIDVLSTIWHEGWHDAHGSILPAELARERTLESFRERIRAALPTVRVIRNDAEPVGFSMIKGHELYQLYVAAQSRGSGAAAVLIDDAEAQLAASGVETAWLACAIGNERAARFYEKRGWRRARVEAYHAETSSGAFPLEIWRYEKVLR
jgi:ribosomal protein S18 acetylase RimI-like enzyme